MPLYSKQFEPPEPWRSRIDALDDLHNLGVWDVRVGGVESGNGEHVAVVGLRQRDVGHMFWTLGTRRSLDDAWDAVTLFLEKLLEARTVVLAAVPPIEVAAGSEREHHRQQVALGLIREMAGRSAESLRNEATTTAPTELEAWGMSLRAARTGRGLTQQAAGELVGVSQAHVSQLERGRRVASLIGAALAAAFDLEPYPPS